MANYHYDEAGNMAAYFILTFLALVLVPVTLSISPSRRKTVTGCQCEQCVKLRGEIEKREGGTLLNPKFTKKSVFLVVGWSIFGFLCYKAGNAKLQSKVYDPFEVLGLSTGTTEKEIKSHFKKLSRMYHPDKVKTTVNQTLEMIQDRFVSITKAYKSLTDETIRKNWELYGHPDGRQETTMGIALPPWIIESKNNIWVLGLYGLIFGGALPALVGRWWFGSQRKTKEGIHARSAAAFFLSLKEESSADETLATLAKAYQWDHPSQKKSSDIEAAVDSLEKEISTRIEKKWETLKELVVVNDAENKPKRRALTLLLAHLLRIPVTRADLQKEQTKLLLQSPVHLNALLTIAGSRNWLIPTLWVIRLSAFITQAILPGPGSGFSRLRFAQLPGIQPVEVELDGPLAPKARDFRDFVEALEEAGDSRVSEVKKAAERWGRLDLIDASFKVIGERIVTPSAIIFLVVKLRIIPPLSQATELKDMDVDATKQHIRLNEEKDLEFLVGSKTAEDVVSKDSINAAHAPHWPGYRVPAWWLVLGDEKNNRLAIPPMKITDVPYTGTLEGNRDYRSYKVQFQAPPNVGNLAWKMWLVSDTYIGEEVSQHLLLRIEDFSALTAEEKESEDDISDPDEDTLAGQMAAMRGGKVKKIEASDDESSTDDDQKDSSDSSSDSD